MNLASVVARWTDASSSLSNGPLRMRAIYSVTSRSPSPEGPVCLTLTSMFENTTLSSSTTTKPRFVLLQTFSSTRHSLVPRPICGRGRGKNGLVSIVCACAEYPTTRGVSNLYVNSPCNFPLYFTHTLLYFGLAGVSSL